MALHPTQLADVLKVLGEGWEHLSGVTGEVISLSFEGAMREIEAERARWHKAAWLRGER